MKIKLGIMLIPLIGFLSSACGQATQPVSTEMTTNYPTLTSTLTRSPIPTSTTTPIIIRNLDPTEQLWATAAAFLDQVQRTSFEATKQHQLALGTQFPSSCLSYPISTTQNGNWLASDCISDREFRVINRDGSIAWRVPYIGLYPPPENPDMIGSVTPLYWTEDNLYLYFTTYYCCVDTDSVSQAESLYRLDIQTGKWSKIIPGYFNYFSFSPTGRRLIHIPNEQTGNGNPVVINIIDLKTGNIDIVHIQGFEQAGWVYWRRDGMAFAITAKNGGAYSSDHETYSLALVDIKTKSVKSIMAFSKMTDSNYEVKVVDWSVDDILTILLTRYESSISATVPEYLYYDLKTNQFITTTPTP